MAASASGLCTKYMAVFVLALVAVNEVTLSAGRRVRKRVRKHAVQLTNTEQANQQGASSSTACVPGDWCPKSNGWYDKGWYNNSKKLKDCCNDGAFITCKDVDNWASCQGPSWESIGHQECCTTQWPHCESNVEEQYCKGDGWMIATNKETANKECCTTSADYAPEVKCHKGWSRSDCVGNGMYKYLGPDKCCEINTCIKLEGSNGRFCEKHQISGWVVKGEGKCCSSENVHCKEGVDSAACTGNGWKYFGNKKCCTTTSQEIQCTEGSADLCKGAGYQYLGNNLCCLMTPEEARPLTCQKVGPQGRCEAPWKHLGEGNCCTTNYAHCEKVAEVGFCNGDGWMVIGNGDGHGSKCCVTLVDQKSEVKCYPGYPQGKCNGKYKYLGTNQCCEIKGEYCISLKVSDGIFCNRNGWTDKGKGTCCTATSQETKITCEDGYTSGNCYGDYKYMGSGKCCWEEYCISLKGSDGIYCKQNGWTDKGDGQCCTTTSHEKKIKCEDGYNSGNCRYKYMGSGKCCWEENKLVLTTLSLSE